MAASDLEQLLLELINDARLDPMGNAARYISSYAAGDAQSNDPEIDSALDFFNVNGPALLAAFSALTAVEPLAWNEDLAEAANDHSQAMISADAQQHVLPGEQGISQRIEAAGYTGWSALAENIYAFSESMLHAHAGFMVDWGFGPNGMQNPPGHRNAIMNANYREVGLGVIAENNGATQVGPLVVTEDFGDRFALDSKVIITGVGYTDTTNDDFYGVGEGVQNISAAIGSGNPVTVATATSGGYSLFTSSSGAQTVTFSNGGLTAAATFTATFAAGHNYKLDIVDPGLATAMLQTSVSGTLGGTGATVLKGLGVTGLTLTTGGGSQTIIGTKGDDTLDGGAGDDTLAGGIGKDIYKYGGQGADKITGFEGGASIGDVVQVTGVYATFAQIQANTTLVNGNADTQIDFGGGNTLILTGFNTALNVNDFAFGPVVPPPSVPEVSVSGNGVDIADGDTSPGAADDTAFGTRTIGELVERTFTVKNDGTQTLTTSGLKLPTGFKLAAGESLLASLAPGVSDTFKVVLDTTKVGAFGGAVTFNTNDGDEAIFNFNISGTVVTAPIPEIDVSGNGANILDNDKTPSAADHTDFGSASFGSAGTIRTFTINNPGLAALNIANVTGPAGFLLGAFPTTIAAQSSATIQVQLDTSATGLRKGDIVITSNDANEATFNFTVQGNVTPQAVAVADDPAAATLAQAHAEAFTGGVGLSSVSYANANAGVVASLLAPTKNTGFAAGDTYSGIENLIGSAFADTLTGNTGNNVIEGGALGDKLDGGTGIDTASYEHGGAVTADLLKAVNNLGEAQGDTYKNIENLRGSAFNDTLTGNTKVNDIDGGGGNDIITGNAGIDTMTGGAGGDMFRFVATKDGSPTGDIITDFVSGVDSIGILRTGFKIATTVTDGDFATHYFVPGAGVTPTTANPSGMLGTESGHGQFLFNETTDKLWWDPDGSGNAKAVLLATLANGAHISADDFWLL